MHVANPLTAAVLCAVLLASAACSRPQPPDKDQPPEPQANTELREAIQQPIDQAKAADAAAREAAEAQRAAIEAATGD
ncbi:hypothetical protein EER27_09100 [Lysobacter psychrotolerans]|uniref:Uncharacterized protein n=2 Tax=Montanilutibacter psychrotolerans TaxID=1327343 RepID=A0A3M8ST85_9GAMM|nr:hypothetical protein [Lysobacter psychrotolerans]RNF84509.1 hypothetical protein EER27_09100 [Lysobacter psychrotolerans]